MITLWSAKGSREFLRERTSCRLWERRGDGMELLFLLNRLNPDMVLLDISMPNLRGIETARQIKMKYPRIKILIVTMHKEREYLYEAISAGVEGYLLKEDAEKELFSAIERIREGKGFVSPIIIGELEESKDLMEGVFKFVLDK
jgi:DNA-binding NarL/FixJ family response regulator